VLLTHVIITLEEIIRALQEIVQIRGVGLVIEIMLTVHIIDQVASEEVPEDPNLLLIEPKEIM